MQKSKLKQTKPILKKKEEAYQTAATEHTEKIDVYADAKLDVQRAAESVC